MKFISICLVLAAVGLVNAQVPGPVPADDGGLEKRACTASKCRCNGVSGLFCGNEKINKACTDGDVFQCNPSGATCTFGVRKSCQQCGKLSC
ncbi:hypothetical protein BD410DRAFT_795764 [Rickenella mellea]|uniref:Uncharacterized protein n=1 Tax=Rickenella mellea TaxID=50990 RepID=A0A4Y7PKP1_9AGAM|nr:hypothetical protein BD410DRAFT_795764 [Rickenella mellea]